MVPGSVQIDEAVPEPPGSRRGPRPARLVAALAIVGVFLVAMAMWRGGEASVPASAWKGTRIEPHRPRPDFVLQDLDGAPYDFRARTAGKLTLLFFGYTSCPDICPIQMATLTGALRTDASLGANVVFVTTDPARDTPGRLREWLAGFDHPVTALTGTPDQLLAAQESAGLAPAISGPPRPDGSYDVGHAAQVLAVTPDDRIHVVYPFGVRREDWLHDLRRMRDEPAWQAGGPR
jgi:protein SCO1/2